MPSVYLTVKSVNWNNAVVTDLYGNVKSNTLPSVTLPHDVLVDTDAPTYQPVIASITGTDSTTPGGVYIIGRESGNVVVRVSLVGFPSTEPGSNLILTWNGVDLPSHLITNDDIANNGVDLAIDKTMLDGLDTTVQVSVRLMDMAGNLSSPLPSTTQS